MMKKGQVSIIITIIATLLFVGGTIVVLEVTDIINIIDKNECSENMDCQTKYKSCVSFCSFNSEGFRECKFGSEMYPYQLPYIYPDCSLRCEEGYTSSDKGCVLEKPNPIYLNQEPVIGNQEDVKQLYERNRIMSFIDPLDSDNLFYDVKGLEKYCTKGILVGDGCKYSVNSELECIPDPEAPNNAITFNRNEMTCTTHYIHTRANVECLRTGKIYDWNINIEREKLKDCSSCEWFYQYMPSKINNLPLTDEMRRGYKGIEEYKGIKLLTFEMDDGRKMYQFCTNNVIKYGFAQDVKSYLDTYIIQQ